MHELQKHARYVTHADGRRCSNLKFFAAVVNTYGKVGQEFEDFASVVDNCSRGKGRGKELICLQGVNMLALGTRSLCKRGKSSPRTRTLTEKITVRRRHAVLTC